MCAEVCQALVFIAYLAPKLANHLLDFKSLSPTEIVYSKA